MKTINGAIEEVLANEGGYVNDPADRGGETNFGITVAVARANGFRGPMRSLTRNQARAIYLRRYAQDPGFDRIGAPSMPIAYELVDIGVNMGSAVTGRFLQRTLNLLVDGTNERDRLLGGWKISSRLRNVRSSSFLCQRSTRPAAFLSPAPD